MPQVYQCPYCNKKIITSSYGITQHFSNCDVYIKQLRVIASYKRKNKEEKIRYY